MPRFQMPDGPGSLRLATRAEITDALSAARCSAELAGMATDEFVVRELLLVVVQHIDRAVSAVRRLD
jgi:hypothetical protein